MIAVRLVLALLAPTALSWHVYNNSAMQEKKHTHKCESYMEATKPVPVHVADRIKLWPGLMKAFDMEYGESVYGFRRAIEHIWKHQYHQNCSKAKFFVSGGWPYGFGSRVHMDRVGLALAIQLGRIYLTHPSGDNFFWEDKIPFCSERGRVGMDCFYEPWSACSSSDLHKGVDSYRSMNPGELADAFQSEESRLRVMKSIENDQSINLVYTVALKARGGYDMMKFIPSYFNHLLQCSPLQESKYFYWWTAVATSYFMRPSEDTLHILAEHRTLPLSDRDHCIGIHVRRGDKGIDMKLQPLSKYLEAAQYMWDRGLFEQYNRYGSPSLPQTDLDQSTNTTDTNASDTSSSSQHGPASWPSSIRGGRVTPHFYDTTKKKRNGTIFLTTEEPDVIAEADAWGKANGWKILYTNLFDRSVMTARKTWDEQHKKGTKAIHDNLEYISMLLNLEYSLRCEAWVGTLMSNSCRLVDELRATLGAKAQRHYADVNPETCNKTDIVDCIDYEDTILVLRT